MEYKQNTTEDHEEITLRTRERSRELAIRQKGSDERHKEKDAHQVAEKARSEALHQAVFDKEQGKEKRAHQADIHNTITERHHAITKNDRDESFEQIMAHVHKELPLATRWFSDLIHRPKVERISELIGNTIARPNALFAGGLTAFLSILGLYSYAKFTGFSLQGSETIIAFIIGWLLGILFDCAKALLSQKR